MALLSQQPIGESPVFHALMDRVSDTASLSQPVLLVGERGTGKELIASRLHFLSPRWEQVYIALNCAAYSEAGLEAQLFGQVNYDGRPDIESVFIKATGGTLFLDHIENVTPRLQEKLLQAVEQRTLYNEGYEEPAEFDVRLLTATSEDLPAAAREGRFRADLLDHIGFHVLGLPPLRERPEDIAPLSQHFGRKIAASFGADRFSGFTPEAMAALMAQSWPGNVRELKRAVERSVAQAFLEDESLLMPIERLALDPFSGAPVMAGAVGRSAPMTGSALIKTHVETRSKIGPDGQQAAAPQTTVPQNTDFSARVMIFERGLIDEALIRAQDHQGRAADYLGLSYHQFRGLLRKHGLKK